MEWIERVAVAIALTVTPAAFAQTYIVSDGDCGAITLHATRGNDFPNLGQTIGPETVVKAYVFVPKQRIAVKPAAAAHSLDFNATVGPDDQVVMASIALSPEVVGNETRTEYAKDLVFCGAKTPMADWQRSTGLGLEIVPQGWNGPRPRMKAGDKMRFIAVVPESHTFLRDLPMELYRAGTSGPIAEGVPDDNGGMDFPYQVPGRYMVKATYRRPDPKQTDRWLVDTSTLTFDIK